MSLENKSKMTRAHSISNTHLLSSNRKVAFLSELIDGETHGSGSPNGIVTDRCNEMSCNEVVDSSHIATQFAGPCMPTWCNWS